MFSQSRIVDAGGVKFVSSRVELPATGLASNVNPRAARRRFSSVSNVPSARVRCLTTRIAMRSRSARLDMSIMHDKRSTSAANSVTHSQLQIVLRQTPVAVQRLLAFALPRVLVRLSFVSWSSETVETLRKYSFILEIVRQQNLSANRLRS